MDDVSIKRLYERKKFFMLLFKEAIGVGNNLLDNQQIRIFQAKEDFSKVTFMSNIDDLNNYIESNRYNINTYFSLATTDGEGGTKDNLKYRYFLAWDFDKKLDTKLDAKEIMFRFKELKLWYHCLIDSGNGYHVYMCLNKTDDLKKVEAVTRAIGEKLGADPDAMLQTQILRVPITFNCKDKQKQVNIVKMFERQTVRPYDINKLYSKYCGVETKKDRTIQYALGKTKFPPCVISILKGVADGDKNFAIKRLISFLKLYRYTESESWNIIDEWNCKNDNAMAEKELEYQFKYLWDKPYNCFGCVTQETTLQAQIKKYCDKELCKNNKKDDILFIEGETLEIEYKLCKKLEPQRKDLLQLKGNHLLIIGVLKNNHEGCNTDEIVNHLTYKDKCCISGKTLSNVLKDLSDNGYITKIAGNKRKKEKDFYKINIIKCDEVEKFNLSYFVILGVIKENISSEDFKVYCYLRYRHSRGLSLTQDKLADELGIKQQTVSLHIQNLLREKYIELKCVDYNSSRFGVNIYKINY